MLHSALPVSHITFSYLNSITILQAEPPSGKQTKKAKSPKALSSVRVVDLSIVLPGNCRTRSDVAIILQAEQPHVQKAKKIKLHETPSAVRQLFTQRGDFWDCSSIICLLANNQQSPCARHQHCASVGTVWFRMVLRQIARRNQLWQMKTQRLLKVTKSLFLCRTHPR